MEVTKQTAIELLRQDLEIKSGTKMVVNWDMYLDLEKQQIIDAFEQGSLSEYYKGMAERFYEKTYGKANK